MGVQAARAQRFPEPLTSLHQQNSTVVVSGRAPAAGPVCLALIHRQWQRVSWLPAFHGIVAGWFHRGLPKSRATSAESARGTTSRSLSTVGSSSAGQ